MDQVLTSKAVLRNIEDLRQLVGSRCEQFVNSGVAHTSVEYVE